LSHDNQIFLKRYVISQARRSVIANRRPPFAPWDLNLRRLVRPARARLAQFHAYVIGSSVAPARSVEVETNGGRLSALDDIVDRAIDYTNRIVETMPSYRAPAIAGLQRLREALAIKHPDDPAIARLDAYLKSLQGGDP